MGCIILKLFCLFGLNMVQAEPNEFGPNESFYFKLSVVS